MVGVLGSSLACPRYCLGLLLNVELKLRRGPVVYNDLLHGTRSVIFCGASHAWICPSKPSVRLGVVLSGRMWLSFGADLHATLRVRYGVGRVHDRQRRSRSRLLRVLGMARMPLGEE